MKCMERRRVEHLRVQQMERLYLFIFNGFNSLVMQPSEKSSPPYYQAVVDVAVYGVSEL